MDGTSLAAIISAAGGFTAAVYAAWKGARADRRAGAAEERSLGIQELEAAVAAQGQVIDRLDQENAGLRRDLTAARQETDECHRERQALAERVGRLEQRLADGSP